jgi:hypothetical protein
MVGAYNPVPSGPVTPAADQGKAKLHDAVKKWADTLCTQLGYEKVIKNPGDYFLIESVTEDLKKIGFLPPGGNLYADASNREDKQVEDLIEKTLFSFDKVDERTRELEGVFFGKTAFVVGEVTAQNPTQRTGGSGNLSLGRYMETHIWKFRTKLPPNAVKAQRAGAGIFAKPWDSSKPIATYIREVKDEGRDAGNPGIESLKTLAKYYQRFWRADMPYLQLRKDLFAGGQTSNAQLQIANGDHAGQAQNGLSGGFFKQYAKAFVELRNYAEALGYYSQACVDKKAEELSQQLKEILPSKIAKRDTMLGRDNVVRAFTGEEQTPRPDPIENLSPFDFQCFLIENVVHLSDLHKNRKYTNLIKLSTGNDPGTVLSRINHGNQTEEVKQLMSLCPEAYALLVPSIKIYRVDYDKENPTKPISEQELHIPNFIDPQDIKDMLGAGGGRSKGYGLKSFNWSLAGVQPAAVDNNITATMTFYFQTIKDLFQGQLAAGQAEASPLDLIISSRASEIVRKNKTEEALASKPRNCGMLRNTINQEYDGASFRIKATIGWNMPTNFASAFPSYNEIVPGTKKSKGTLITEALRHTKMSLFLQQTRHMLDFKENGSIELSIDYQAALSGILKEEKANILATDKTFFEDEIEGYRLQIEATKDSNFALGGGTDTRTAEQQGLKDDRVEELLEQIEQLQVQNRMFQYKKFLQKLYEKNNIYNIAVPPAELLIPQWKDLTVKQRAARAKRRLSPNEAERGFFNVDLESTSANNTFDTTLLKAVETASKEPGKAEDELQKQAVNNAKRFNSFSLNNETIMIPYFYLGDLLDLVLETLPGYDDGEKFLFFLSEIELLNPLLAFQVKNLREVMCTDKLSDAKFLSAMRNSDPTRFSNITQLHNIINIGDIPISLDAFTVWFKDNIIKKDIDNYYFLQFVKDVCSQLISNALRGDCFGDAVKFDIRFDAAQVHLRTGLKPGVPTTVKALATKKQQVSTNSHPKETIPALIIYSTDAKPKSRRGDFDADLKVGIYHHYVGSACSIVKSINFQREDQPYLREAKIQKQGALNATQLRELYSVNLDLIGNTLYRNGQYIYVDPTMVAGNPTLARMLGISGYYMVTSVDHKISDAGYDVKIRALQEGISFDENSQALSVQFLDGAMEGVPTWTPPEITAAQLDMMGGDAADAAVDAAGAGVATYAEELAEVGPDIATLVDDELNWDDALQVAKMFTGADDVVGVAEAQYKAAKDAWDQWKANRTIQAPGEEELPGAE